MEDVLKNREQMKKAAFRRAERLINALEHIKTANNYDRNANKHTLKNWLEHYEEYPEKWNFELTQKLRHSCELAEGFLYRVVQKYDKH